MTHKTRREHTQNILGHRSQQYFLSPVFQGKRKKSKNQSVSLLVAQSCLSLCGPMDCNPPGPSVHGILSARIMEWLANPYPVGSSQSRDRTLVSCIS